MFEWPSPMEWAFVNPTPVQNIFPWILNKATLAIRATYWHGILPSLLGQDGSYSPWWLSLAALAWACLEQLIRTCRPSHVFHLTWISIYGPVQLSILKLVCDFDWPDGWSLSRHLPCNTISATVADLRFLDNGVCLCNPFLHSSNNKKRLCIVPKVAICSFLCSGSRSARIRNYLVSRIRILPFFHTELWNNF